MKIFILQNIGENLTNNYHDGGGAVVIADDLESAKKVLRETNDNDWEEFYPHIDDKYWENTIVYDLKDDCKPIAYIFPDAGCC